jgi:hypothetical protein
VCWTIWGSISGRGKRFFYSPKCAECLWFLPSLLVNAYWGVLSLEVKWVRPETTTDFHLVLRLRMNEAFLLLLLCAFMACTGTT